mmetsp:Transcript_55413/g.154394  ORF Transcript_55413/g.154394 Transcript_55413/m.154394 type:complete len:207 (-) Transcript_55413:392-1012(-)
MNHDASSARAPIWCDRFDSWPTVTPRRNAAATPTPEARASTGSPHVQASQVPAGTRLRALGPSKDRSSGPYMCSNSSSRKRHMPRSTICMTLSACWLAYAMARVVPHEPPQTTQRSIPRCPLTASMSSTSSHVVLPANTSRTMSPLDAPDELDSKLKPLEPQPRWSKRITRYNDKLNKRDILREHPAPGPPCRNTAGKPSSGPKSS